MYVCDVRKKYWYIDIIIQCIEELSFSDIVHLKEAGVTSEPLPRIELRLRRRESPFECRNPRMLPNNHVGEEIEDDAGGFPVRENGGTIRVPSDPINNGLGDLVREWRNKGGTSGMGTRERSNKGRDFYDRVLKIDVDVPTEYYDPNKLLQDKLKMLRSLGYTEANAYWKPSSSGHHIHIVIELTNDVELSTLFYLQFMLGDDHKRSTLNFFRLKYFPDKAKYFNVLFTEKVKITRRRKVMFLIKHLLRKVF
jgi:hypothetical protein